MTDNHLLFASYIRGRRNAQRYRRGAHTSFLNANARVALTQHLARKSCISHRTLVDPLSTMLGKYHSTPLNARCAYAAVLSPHHTRANMTTDPILHLHPSARLDLQSPLLLQLASPNHMPGLIESYYVT